MIDIIELTVQIATLYVVIGSVIGIAFIVRGVARIDHNASGTGIGFRLAILPGCVALWPLLLSRWMAGSPPAEEANAHRDAARAKEGR